jgi:beta-glucosidase
MTTRREALVGLAATSLIGTAPALAAASRKLPKDFLWGTAISAHQSEGNDVNSDCWLLENLPNSVFKDPSGDACDSYHRYEEDIDIAQMARAQLLSLRHRMGADRARTGHVLPGRARPLCAVLEACRKRGLLPSSPIIISPCRAGSRCAAGGRSPTAPICSRAFANQRRALGRADRHGLDLQRGEYPLLAKLLRMGVRADRSAASAR